MNLNEEVEQDLREKTEDILENDVLESNSKPEMKNKSGPQDEKIERQAFSETGASMTPEEVEFLARQRTNMDNEELRNFLAGEHEVQDELRSWEPFSRTEEKFLLQNVQTQSVEEIAESMNKDPEKVEIQLQMMGLDQHME